MVAISMLKAKKNKINIATSWNPNRFTAEQMDTWLVLCRICANENVPIKVLITLTPDLFKMNMREVLSVFDQIEGAGITKFLFEPLVGDECNREADEWLCKFHKKYKGNMENELESSLNNYIHNCSSTYTMEPDGTIRHGCPQYKERVALLEECTTCERAAYCQPCVLQRTCSYPKKLGKLINA